MREQNEAVFPDGYEEREGCLYGPDREGDTVQYTFTSLRVYALVRTADNDSWSYDIEVGDSDGNVRQVIIPAKDLVGGGKSVLAKLVNAGLCILPGCEKGVISFLMLSRPKARRVLAPASGWLGKEHVFVTPCKVIGKMSGAEVIFSPESNSPAQKTVRQQGTLTEWKREVAQRAVGNPILLFSILVALLGPLIRVLRLDGGGFNLYGRSSGGKTTCLGGAGSVWGEGSDPAIKPETSFIRRWNITANAVEGIAAVYNGMLTALDELATFVSGDFGAVIYSLTGGQGRVALNSSRNLQKTRSWEGNVLSSGEITTQQKIEETGGRVKAGQLLRMINIPVTDKIILDTKGQTATDFVLAYKHACSTYFGTAGPAFVQALIEVLEVGDENRGALLEALEEFSISLTPDGLEPEQVRGIRRFAALQVAGELAVQIGILPCEESEIQNCVEFARDLWLQETRSIGDTERAIRALRHFILSNISAFPNVLDSRARVANCKGFRNPNRDVFLFTDEQLQAATGHEPKDLARELRKRNYLTVEEPGRLKVGQKIAALRDKRIRFYAVKASILESSVEGETAAITEEKDQRAMELSGAALPEFECQ